MPVEPIADLGCNIAEEESLVHRLLRDLGVRRGDPRANSDPYSRCRSLRVHVSAIIAALEVCVGQQDRTVRILLTHNPEA